MLHLVASPVKDETSLHDRFFDIFQAAGIELFTSYVDQSEHQDDETVHDVERSREEQQQKRSNGHVDKWLNEQHELRPLTETETLDIVPQRQKQTNGVRSVSQPIPRPPSISRDELGRMRIEDLPLRGRRQSRASSVGQAHRSRHSISRISSVGDHRASSVDAGTLPSEKQKQRWRDVSRRANDLLQPHTHDLSVSLASESAIIEQAEAFRDIKDLKRARALLRHWIHSTRTRTNARVEADKHHQNALREQADEQSRAKLARLEQETAARQKRFEEKEMERVSKERDARFAAIEPKVEQAYDAHIQQLALTQWNVVSTEKIELTDVARRHLKTMRCFDNWEALTRNEALKREDDEESAQRFHQVRMLQSMLRVWWFRTERLIEEEDKADCHDETRLKKRCVKYLLLGMLSKKCYGYHGSNIAKRKFVKWQQYVADLQNRLRTFEEDRAERIKRQYIFKWRELAQRSRQMNDQARQFRAQHLLRTHLSTWMQACNIEQRSRRLATSHQQQLLRVCWERWTTQTSARRRADAFNQHHLQKRTLLQLRLQLRARVVSNEVESRLGSEALYKWCLATKAARSCRQLEHRMTTNIFQHWANKVFEQRAVLEETEEFFVQSQTRRRQITAIGKWTQALVARQQQQQAAQQFREEHQVRQTFEAWRDRTQHVTHLTRRSDAARFYVLASRTLKTWLDATTEHQKTRRREAYAEVRRQHKVVLARTCLHKLRDVLANRRALVQVAAEREDDRLMNLMIRSWGHWREIAAKRSEQTERAMQYERRQLAHLALTKLSNRAAALSRINLIADSFSQAAVEKSATTCLRRLDRRIFQIQAQGHLAVTLRNRLLEKHVRGMLKYWKERTMAIREGRAEKRGEMVNEEDDISPETIPEDLLVQGNYATLGNQFDPYTGRNVIDDFEQQGAAGEIPSRATTTTTATGTATSATLVPYVATPLPGYLRTPSKRNTALAKARSRLLELGDGRNAATPATAPARSFYNHATTVRLGEQQRRQQENPVITPFESKLRRQGYRTGVAASATSEGRIGAVARDGNLGYLSSPVTTGLRTVVRSRDVGEDAPGAASARRGGRLQSSRVPFAGFDDITEDMDDA